MRLTEALDRLGLGPFGLEDVKKIDQSVIKLYGINGIVDLTEYQWLNVFDDAGYINLVDYLADFLKQSH